MEIDNTHIKVFNSKTAWNNTILEGFTIGMYHIMPRMIHLSRSQGNRSSERHSHHIWEFNIILNGTMRFYWGDQSAILKPGDVFFISPDALHGWQLLSSDFMILGLQTSISFPEGSIASKQTLSDAMDRVEHHSHDNPNISVWASNIIQLMLNKPAFYREQSRLIIQSIYIEIFKLLFPRGLEFDFEQDELEITMGMPGKRIAEVLEYYVNDNMNKEIKVSEICKRFHLSQCQLNRICRRETGMTTIDYIAARKINMGKHLLNHTERMVKEIAEITGFQSVNYFCRKFRKITGMTPEQYRKKYR